MQKKEKKRKVKADTKIKNLADKQEADVVANNREKGRREGLLGKVGAILDRSG